MGVIAEDGGSRLEPKRTFLLLFLSLVDCWYVMAFLFLILTLGTHAPYTKVQHLQALLIWLCVHSFGLWLCFFPFHQVVTTEFLLLSALLFSCLSLFIHIKHKPTSLRLQTSNLFRYPREEVKRRERKIITCRCRCRCRYCTETERKNEIIASLAFFFDPTPIIDESLN